MTNFMLILLVGLFFTLSGCEAMKGLGADIQKAGKALERKLASNPRLLLFRHISE